MYAQYTNHVRATKKFPKSVGYNTVRFEFSSYTVTHHISNQEPIKMNALKFGFTEQSGTKILNGLIDALTKTPTAHSSSTTVDFKLIPFLDNVIGK